MNTDEDGQRETDTGKMKLTQRAADRKAGRQKELERGHNRDTVDKRCIPMAQGLCDSEPV